MRTSRPGEVLTRRALNRATLARQLLLRRAYLSVPEAVEHLAGLQAQTPTSWYVALWSRLEGFRPESVAELITERALVRIALMRSTIHLVTALDGLSWRPLVQPVVERSMKGNFGRRLAGMDTDALTAAGRALVEDQPRTFDELGKLLAERWPDRDPAALAQAIRAWVPLVQVPPRGLWGSSGPAAHTSAEAWLGQPLASDPSVDEMVLRYLAALGPATVRDIQTWSGLTRLREVTERLRPKLVTFRDENGRELFDLPDAPRPDPEVPAPPRFLPDYDNLFLSHADRTRLMSAEGAAALYTQHGPVPGAVLIDGFIQGGWELIRQGKAATLAIHPVIRPSKQLRAGLTDEGAALLAFLAPEAETRDVRFV